MFHGLGLYRPAYRLSWRDDKVILDFCGVFKKS